MIAEKMKLLRFYTIILITFISVMTTVQVVSASENVSVEEQLKTLAEKHLETTYGVKETILYQVEIKRVPSLLKQRADTILSLSYPGSDLPKGYVTYDVTWKNGNDQHSVT